MILLGVGVFLFSTFSAEAASIKELRDQIEGKNRDIQEIEAEIAAFERELQEVGAEKETLESAIAELSITRNKLLTDIRLTENKIESTSYSIEKVVLEIGDTEARILGNTKALGESLRRINIQDEQSLVEALLAHDTLSDFWDEVGALSQFQNRIRAETEALAVLKEELNERRGALSEEERELRQLEGQLSGQRQVIEANKREKDTLLKKTANKEEEYQALLEEKRRQREQFEAELLRFEQELEFAIDPSKLPAGAVLGWPLKDATGASCYGSGADYTACITQYFGNTPFASTNAYNGHGHNGIDFRASVGTPVLSALSGIIEGAGNTDLERGCYSYGKWVLVRHNNGLATLYAHLSNITVSKGEQVQTGDIIGLSGNTGYSTGPHLHFTVFASEGISVQRFSNSINCKNVAIPLPDKRDAYLNPLGYLPPYEE